MGLAGAWFIAARSVAVCFCRRKVGIGDCGFDVLQDGDLFFVKGAPVGQGFFREQAAALHPRCMHAFRVFMGQSKITKVSR